MAGEARLVTGSDSGVHAVPEGFSDRLYNEDLAPVKERDWGVYSLFAMWMSDVHSIGGYTFAAGLFFLGLVAWQVFAALIVGIFVVYFLMNLTGIAGMRHGIPYPVLARVSFGVFGANLPALIRAVVAIFWYGIQTYLASVAAVLLAVQIFPGVAPLAEPESGLGGLSALGWGCFLFLWVVQLLILTRGMDMVRRYQDVAGPLVYVVMFALAGWILYKSGWSLDLNLGDKQLSTGQAVFAFLTAISLIVAYFSTLLLNFCDFSRFAPDERTVKRGNFLGLPVNFFLFSLTTVIVTAGSIKVYGEAITDPVALVGRLDNPIALIVGALTFVVATIGINIVANFVSPAYDLANVAPKHITFARGGVIAAVGALFTMPWKIYGNPLAVNYFLGALGAFLGPLFGILIADYYLLKKGRVSVPDLYSTRSNGQFWYQGGINLRAVAAFVPSALLTSSLALLPAFGDVAAFSWFIGVVVAGGLYLALMRGAPAPAPAAHPAR
jgi:NCS1 family nucleobase:cation symporter-1